MATYEEIYGKRVKEFDSDPTLESSYEGQVWYDKSSGVLKSVVAFESVTSQTPMTTARYMLAGAGSTTAGLAFGGDSAPPITGATEEFNGSGWTTGGSLNQARQGLGGAGTQTAGLGFGGYNSGPKNNSEEYDGSSWTAGNVLGGARYRLIGIGIQTAALACAGKGGSGPSPGAVETTVEQYNGTSWTSGTALSTARQSAGAAGTYTSGLICGGGATPTSPGGGTTNTGASEEWDGSSWTTGGTMPVTKRAFAGLNGLQTAAIMMGGAPNATTVQTYDGTSWATSPATLTTARHGGAGTKGQPGTAGLAIGGYDPSNTTGATEEYNLSINTITAAAFASGGNLGTARYSLAGSGTETAALASGGGSLTTVTGDTEEYNGTSWAEQNNLSTARRQFAGGGPQTAAFVCCGKLQPNNDSRTDTEEYSGSSWTSGGSTSNARRLHSALGTQTAGLAIAGFAPPVTSTCEEYDGSSWTAGGGLSGAARYRNFSTGIQTAGLTFGGVDAPEAALALTEEYDGSSWTAGGTLNTAASGGAGSGIQTSALAFATQFTGTERYDGTSWATGPALATPRTALGGSNNASSNSVGLFFGGGPGNPPSNVNNNTESFTGETETVTFKTLTTS